MYSKQQASHIRQEFWTTFGRYMQPVVSAEGTRINWINYRTGVKHIHFRMHAGNGASIGIEITDPEMIVQQQIFEKFTQLKHLFTTIAGEGWTWQPPAKDANQKNISRIYTGLDEANILNRAHWPRLISFLKQHIIALDKFWSEVKPAFEA